MAATLDTFEIQVRLGVLSRKMEEVGLRAGALAEEVGALMSELRNPDAYEDDFLDRWSAAVDRRMEEQES